MNEIIEPGKLIWHEVRSYKDSVLAGTMPKEMEIEGSCFLDSDGDPLEQYTHIVVFHGGEWHRHALGQGQMPLPPSEAMTGNEFASFMLGERTASSDDIQRMSTAMYKAYRKTVLKVPDPLPISPTALKGAMLEMAHIVLDLSEVVAAFDMPELKMGKKKRSALRLKLDAGLTSVIERLEHLGGE